jgi:hypothetical protein
MELLRSGISVLPNGRNSSQFRYTNSNLHSCSPRAFGLLYSPNRDCRSEVALACIVGIDPSSIGLADLGPLTPCVSWLPALSIKRSRETPMRVSESKRRASRSGVVLPTGSTFRRIRS